MSASEHLPRWGRTAAGVILLAGLGSLSRTQSHKLYQDNITLYQSILEQNPVCWMAHNNLAIALADAGQVKEAIPHLLTALKLRPDYPQALNNLGDDLTHLGRSQEAIPYLERAVAIQPNFYQAHCALGNALFVEKKFTEAIRHYEEALKINPWNAIAEHSLGFTPCYREPQPRGHSSLSTRGAAATGFRRG